MIKRLVLLGCLLALVATASPTSASAEDDYRARIPTRTDVTVRQVIDSGVSFVIEVAVQANSPVDPTGTITATVTRLSDQGGDRASVSRSSARRGPSAPGEQVWTTSVAHTGGETSISGPTLNEVGRYRVVATFEPDLRSVFRGSQGGATLRVVDGSGPDNGDGDEDSDAGGGALPNTGGPDFWLLLLGLGLVGSGGTLVVVGRRRRPAPSFG